MFKGVKGYVAGLFILINKLEKIKVFVDSRIEEYIFVYLYNVIL